MTNFSLTGGVKAPQVAVSSKPQTEAAPQAAPAHGAPPQQSALPATLKPPQQPLGDYMADAPVTSEPPCNPLIEDKLSPSQTQVLQAIMAGKSISAAAQSAGVSRTSVYRWQRDDANYIAALNAWKQQTEDSVRHRLLAMADRAVVAINNALLSCDAKAGFTLLKAMGLLAPPQKSSTDPGVIAKELEIKRQRTACRQMEQAKKLKQRARWAEL